tara:strand:+ start:171 stop:554 length:384 start_codon:yes stop_codon:yes gene_type:complete
MFNATHSENPNEQSKEQALATRRYRKEVIAKLIANENTTNYEDNLEIIYDNQYRKLLKVPVTLFIIGIVQSFHTNFANIDLIKEVVKDAIEFGGIELEVVDEEWDALEIIDGDLNSTKKYMSEFFKS